VRLPPEAAGGRRARRSKTRHACVHGYDVAGTAIARKRARSHSTARAAARQYRCNSKHDLIDASLSHLRLSPPSRSPLCIRETGSGTRRDVYRLRTPRTAVADVHARDTAVHPVTPHAMRAVRQDVRETPQRARWSRSGLAKCREPGLLAGRRADPSLRRLPAAVLRLPPDRRGRWSHSWHRVLADTAEAVM